jgi:membrane protein YdbS with pleckstrin-like domain
MQRVVAKVALYQTQRQRQWEEMACRVLGAVSHIFVIPKFHHNSCRKIFRQPTWKNSVTFRIF